MHAIHVIEFREFIGWMLHAFPTIAHFRPKDGPLMAWDFETDPDFQKELDWIDEVVRSEIEALRYVSERCDDTRAPTHNKLIKPLQEIVRKRNLWGCHLGPDLGGPGY